MATSGWSRLCCRMPAGSIRVVPTMRVRRLNSTGRFEGLRSLRGDYCDDSHSAVEGSIPCQGPQASARMFVRCRMHEIGAWCAVVTSARDTVGPIGKKH